MVRHGYAYKSDSLNNWLQLMIAKVEPTLPDFRPHLNSEQQLHSATVLAFTENSTVFALRVKEKETERQMAVKIYAQEATPPPILNHLLNRPHKHLVDIIRIKSTKPASVCMELCSQDLRGYCQIQQQQTLPAGEVARVAGEICEGLFELRSLRLMHGDLKPQNILVSSQKVIKLGDLDFLLRQEQFSKRRMRVGTLQYMAPEVLSDWHCSYASDMWSLGIIIYQLFFGRHPFPQIGEMRSCGENTMCGAMAIINDQLPRIRQHIKQSQRECQQPIPNVLLTVMLQCLRLRPQQRCSLQEVIALLQIQPPQRKSSWSTEHTLLTEDDIFMFPNTGLLLAFEKLQDILSSLPEEGHRFREVLKTMEEIRKEEKNGGYNDVREKMEGLRSVLLAKYKKMERNFKRLANFEGGVGYSSKGELFLHIKYILQLMEESLNGPQLWLAQNKTRSAQFLQ